MDSRDDVVGYYKELRVPKHPKLFAFNQSHAMCRQEIKLLCYDLRDGDRFQSNDAYADELTAE